MYRGFYGSQIFKPSARNSVFKDSFQKSYGGYITIIAVVGMPGSGRTLVSKIIGKKGFERIRFGDTTDNELKKKGLEINEENERFVRESIRMQHGMDAYAKMNLPRITIALKKANKVVIDGMYSLEEFLFLRKKFPELVMVAVLASPEIRHERLMKKPKPLTLEDCVFRDISMIENLRLGGPIALADYNIVNENTTKELEKNTDLLLKKILSPSKKQE